MPMINLLRAHAWRPADPERRAGDGAGGLCGIPARRPQLAARSLAARTFTDIRRWTRMPKGGHFAALEQPELLAADIIAFFAGLG